LLLALLVMLLKPEAWCASIWGEEGNAADECKRSNEC
jgi:hypothetical protein